MSIETVKSEITRFLESEPPEVMAIKGKWGTGKTHLWNDLLQTNKNEIKLEKYSYVSLFGINSLDVFKYAIFENTVSRNLIGKEISVETFQEDSTGLLKTIGMKSLDILKSKSNSHAVESLAFLSVRNTLICIDDLERKGKGLKLKDVLGLVSLLKEQRNCKVVLLLNEGEEGLKDYATYCEKVVDIELVFAPTAKENVEIAFDGKNDYAIQVVKESAIKLNIKNIRVLKQIERFIGLITPHLSDYEPEITQQVALSLTLFAWCHYCHDDNNVPSLDFISTTKSFLYLGFNEKKDETDEQKKYKKWKNIIFDYGYTHTDELNLLLADVVKMGYVTTDKLIGVLEKKNAEIIASKSATSYHDAWNIYRDRLENNETEVLNALFEEFTTNIKYLSVRDLDQLVVFFRRFEANDKAEEIIDKYIELRKEESELFNVKIHLQFDAITDQSIKDKFRQVYTSLVLGETAEQVLDRIAGLNGWNPEDLIILANTSVDDYYELFKSINNYERRTSFIKKCLEFGQFENPDSEYKEIANRATQALKKIASECRINKIRLQHFGIEVD
jgi:hypothetical protein